MRESDRLVCALAALTASLALAGPGLAQTMGGLQQMGQAAAPRGTAPPARPVATTPAATPAITPAPTASRVRDLDAAAPQNIRPPCDCPPPRHPTLEPQARIVFEASRAGAGPATSAAHAPPPPQQLAETPAPATAPGTPGLVLGPNWTDPAWRTRQRPYSVQTDAPWQIGAGVVAPPAATDHSRPGATVQQRGQAAREPRGPFTRIWQDSRRAVVTDMPEALANALPWVDRERKDASFEEVLARVSQDLANARQNDPEWALAAERQVRALDASLARLSAPPQAHDVRETGIAPALSGADARPFRPRPVWPGAAAQTATGNSDGQPQARPSALGTVTPVLDGPSAHGQAGSWQAPADLAEPSPPEPVASPRRSRSRPR